MIYPSGLIGELAERQLIEPVSERALDSEEHNRRDILELSRQREVAWGEQVVAFSFGSPQLTLMYRRDIFERLQLTPPPDLAGVPGVGRAAERSQGSGGIRSPGWSAVVGGRGTARAGMGRPTALSSISSLRSASQPVFHAVRLPRHDAPDQWSPLRAGVDRIAQCRETLPSGVAGADTRRRPPSCSTATARWP